MLRELIVPFLIGTVSVVLMFLANMLIYLANQVVFTKEVPLAAVGQLLLFKVPSTLNLTLPVGITIAASLAMSRLARESELSAIRAAGIPVRRVMVPILLLGVGVSVLSFYLADRVSPTSEAKALATMRKMFASAQAIGIQSNVLLKLNNGEYHVSIGSVRRDPMGGVEMDDVLVFWRPKKGEEWTVTSDRGHYLDGLLTLYKPIVRGFEGALLKSFEEPETFVVNQRVSVEDFFPQPLPEEQNAHQLRQTILAYKERGADTRGLEVDYHNKFAVPAACLVFALFAPVFALYFARGGAFIGVLVSIIIVFLYYNIWVVSAQVLAKQWILPPLVGAWLPNVLYAVFGGVALWRAE